MYFQEYKILGACNPPFAYKALQAETELGLMLPCNVIVYRKDGKTFAASILPTTTMKTIGNPKLEGIAREVEAKLKKAVDAI